MRHIGTQAFGIRLPLISKGDDLAQIVVDSIEQAVRSSGIQLSDKDVIGITEAVVAKSQGNYASIDDIASDIRVKFPDGTVGLVFPILSRNRFLNIMKGIARGAKKVFVLLKHPSDEVGNPIMDLNLLDEVEDKLHGLVSAKDFRKIVGEFAHPFTGVDYISLYEQVGDNVEVYLSSDPRDILKLTDNVLVGEVHSRFRTKQRLMKAGAKAVFTLSDVLSTTIGESGSNPDFGVLGSNFSTGESLKLFPTNCYGFLSRVEALIDEKLGVIPHLLVYGGGAFKDPACGIWELANPVVSLAYSRALGGRPNEIKMKFVAENNFGHLSREEKTKAVTKMIREKAVDHGYAEGTTPRKYADLLGSLCDLMSGSGDKGTPVILIQGYFDDYATE